MSVINQMLKDLDQRQQSSVEGQPVSAHVSANKGTRKWLIITIIFILLINVLGIYIWQLYSENQQLKNAQLSANNQQGDVSERVTQRATTQPVEIQKNTRTEAIETENTTDEDAVVHNNDKLASDSLAKPLAKSDVTALEKSESNSALQSADAATAAIKPMAQQSAAVIANAKERQTTDDKLVEIAQQTPVVKEQPAQLSISRKQLTSQQLVAKKLTQAEQALNSHQLTDAERLFEDILLIAPKNKTARKQLAALWFGRKSYQAAVNLLSQGIALAPFDSEYRLMKARVYLSQGQRAAAVETLKALADIENTEYQALLASNAQLIEQYQVAIKAYSLLVRLQPNVGRWWLGLAVAYDSDSQFEQAQSAYLKVKDNSDISDSARQFARQRLQELGE
ncbi:tetratricopeptide repeat protein [Thalassotalea sp. G2M2-11]|uniref:tetratricopeptide repeat protein n=1 Tax=Thalassotalea sp. G2M2-11 TaxID=2787627 RepID=UPI0019D1E599|nr:tetratricopeptide repeat protein [Thalassotalea sp. G2M2-11]